MIRSDVRTLLRALAVAVAFCSTVVPAHASFITAIDDFTITRNGGAFFSDPFSDGAAPPSAPNFAGGTPATYSVFGTSQTETGGKYYMDSALGDYTLAGDGTARLRNVNTLNTDTTTDPTRGLKTNHTFTVSGRFDLDMVSAARDGYGISLKDATGPAPGFPTAGQVWSIFVGKNALGVDGIYLILQDYTTQTITPIAFSALDWGHDQILLKFDRNSTGSNLAHASWQYWDGGVANGGFNTLGDATIFQSQQWVRTDFFTNQETPVVPLPSAALLLVAGCGALAVARRVRP